ncbi:hypothetical protein [Tautonia plasticadhaerens]|nr:hypothetical protein [Tautonia plasticadhaerens]
MIALARKVKSRHFLNFDPRLGGPDSVASMVYEEQMTCRWG